LSARQTLTPVATQERKELVNETQSLLRYHQEFQSLFGEEEFTQRKADLLSGTRDITEKLRNVVRYPPNKHSIPCIELQCTSHRADVVVVDRTETRRR
jgi:DNA-directed RNA polymerase subunit F